MRLPNWESAYVPEPKLSQYLLSETHTTGKWKALLLSDLGYDVNNIERLKQDLLTIANTRDVTGTVVSEYGTKYIIEGLLQSPSGNVLMMRTVWMIGIGESRPRFVTAYPV